ncbi:MAG: ZIP family metal transporter [Bacillota bacterium]|nr:ZIP family metal transporter [Bacillota bacterium]
MELYASLLAGIGTLAGAALGLAGPGRRLLAAFLGLASAVMLAVVAGELIPTALDFGGTAAAAVGLLGGVAAVAALDVRLSAVLGPSHTGYVKMGVLALLGIALHDLPEGLAIAAGFAATPRVGFLTAVMIGLHNVPEGMATAAPLRAGGVRPARILLVNALLSLVTPLGTYIGLFITTTALSICLLSAAAAGAMLYVVLFGLLPRSLYENVPASLAGALLGAVIFGGLLSFL